MNRTDVPYTNPVPAETRGNLLDVYVPPGDEHEPRPVLIWSGGSAWLRDDGKEKATHIADIFTPLGYAVVGLSIRSSGHVQFPGQLHDIRAAIRWVRTNAGGHNFDSERIAIMGNSSGGWVAAMAAVTGSIHQFDHEPDVAGVSSAVQAAVCFFPPTDFLAMDAQTLDQKQTYDLDYLPMLLHDDASSPESLLVGCAIQTCREKATTANPISYVDGSEPPVHILHGTADPLLPPGQSDALYHALKAAGARVSFTLVDGGGHRVDETLVPQAPLPGAALIDAASSTVMTSDRFEGERSERSPGPTWPEIARFLDHALGR